MLLGFAVGISAAAPASAQGSGSDAGGGHGAILSRPEGAITPTGPLAAASLEPFWTSVKTAFGRYRFPIWARVRDLGGTNAAYLPPRKRVAP
jgi:hypothetical protein